MSPSFFHTLTPICLVRLELSLGNTFSDTFKNFSSVYLSKKRRLNLDCKGFDSRLISLQLAKTLAPFISKSYCFFCWSTLTLPDSMKFKSWFWNGRDILSSSSIQIILGLLSCSTSKILVFQNTRRFSFLECLVGIRSWKKLMDLQKAGCNSRLILAHGVLCLLYL